MTDVRNRKRDDISIGVVERFFTAFDIVQPCTVQEFCTKLGVYRQKFYKQKTDTAQHYIDFSWLTLLVNVGVSAEWLLTGRGEMLKRKSCVPHDIQD